MKKLISLTFILSLIFDCYSSGENYHIGGRSAGLGNSSVTLKDSWSIHHNQAGLAFNEKMTAGIYYESRFATPELGLKGGIFVLPTNSGTFGLSVTSFGFKLYNETKVGLAYGRKFGENFSAGVQLDYISVGLGENYGRSQAVTIEAGILANLSDELTVGAHVFNPNRSQIADYDDELLPAILRLGANYKFSEKVFVTAEMEKDVDHKPIFKSGLEYHISKPLFLRAGISSNPFVSSFGFGILLKQFQFDFATSYHSILGYTPQLSLGYSF